MAIPGVKPGPRRGIQQIWGGGGVKDVAGRIYRKANSPQPRAAHPCYFILLIFALDLLNGCCRSPRPPRAPAPLPHSCLARWPGASPRQMARGY